LAEAKAVPTPEPDATLAPPPVPATPVQPKVESVFLKAASRILTTTIFLAVGFSFLFLAFSLESNSLVLGHSVNFYPIITGGFIIFLLVSVCYC